LRDERGPIAGTAVGRRRAGTGQLARLRSGREASLRDRVGCVLARTACERDHDAIRDGGLRSTTERNQRPREEHV
jgi:hypothetical protein